MSGMCRESLILASVYIVPLSVHRSVCRTSRKNRQVDLIDIKTRVFVLCSYIFFSLSLSLCVLPKKRYTFMCVHAVCPVVHLLISLSPGIYPLYNISLFVKPFRNSGRACERSQ